MLAPERYAQELRERNPIPAELKEPFDWYYRLVEGTERWLKTALDAQPTAPVILLPTGGLNAYAASVPGTSNQAVVILELRLLIALEFIIELAVWAVQCDPPEFRRDPDDLAAIAGAMEDLFELPLDQARGFRDPGFVFGQAPQDVLVMTLSTCTAFIIGHEYAHIRLGHLGRAARRSVWLGAHDELEAFSYSQELELAADEESCRWILDTVPEADGPSPVRAAPFFCCSWFGFLDRLRGEDPSMSSHPEGITRFGRLFEEFEDRLSLSEQVHALQMHTALLEAWSHRPS